MSECCSPARNDELAARGPGCLRPRQLFFVRYAPEARRTTTPFRAEAELRAHFGEAWISGYEPLIPRMANDEKDRHVLAAAAHGQTSIILTLNLRHFRPEHLKPWGIRALHPQSFLSEICREEQMLVVKKLEQQAGDRGRSLRQLLNILSATAPEFAALVSSTIPRE